MAAEVAEHRPPSEQMVVDDVSTRFPDHMSHLSRHRVRTASVSHVPESVRRQDYGQTNGRPARSRIASIVVASRLVEAMILKESRKVEIQAIEILAAQLIKRVCVQYFCEAGVTEKTCRNVS